MNLTAKARYRLSIKEIDILQPENVEWYRKYRYLIPVLHIPNNIEKEAVKGKDSSQKNQGYDELYMWKIKDTKELGDVLDKYYKNN